MCFFYCTFIYLLLRSPGRPTAANDGQRRPTKTKKAPNDARGVVWALGKVFFCFFSVLLTTQAHSSQRRPTQANTGQHRPTKDNAGPRRRKGATGKFFFSFSVLLTTKAHSSQGRPTQANTGQCRPTKAHEDKTGPKLHQTRRLCQRCVFSFLFFLCFIDNESLQQPTKANEGQHRSMQAHSRAQGWVYSPPPTTHHHHHRHLTTSSTSSTTITRARDASRTLVLSFYSPPSPSLGPETRLRPSVSFYFFYFILYFTGAKTRLWSLFVLFYFYFILFYSSKGTKRLFGPFFFFFFFILFFFISRD